MSNTLRDIDLPWVATDEAGRLGIFTTAGEGPVPPSALQVGDAADAVIARLPDRGEAELLIQIPRPDDFVAWARRGLYVYDWLDAHRTRSALTDCYELVAKPTRPVTLGDLSPDQRLPFEATVLLCTVFGHARVPGRLFAR